MRRLLILVLLFPVLLGIGPVAAAGNLKTELVGLSPEWLNRPTSVEVSLLVSSEIESSELSVQIDVSKSPLVGRSQIALARNNKLEVETVSALRTSQALGVGQNLWTFQIPAAAFKNAENGVYLIDLTIGSGTNASHLQTLLPVLRDQFAVEAVPTVVLWEITNTPSSFADGKFVSQALADQFSNQTNSVLVASSGRSGLTVLVNPATVVDAQRLAAGGQVQFPERADLSVESVSAAANWLNQYRASMNGKDFYYLPYAETDLNGLWFKNQNELAAVAMQTLDLDTTDLPFSLNSGAVIPARGDFSERVWNQHGGQLPELVVVRSDRFPAVDDSYTPAGIVEAPNGSNALVVDIAASSSLSAAMIEHTAVKGKQALLAETLLIALERPNDSRLLVLNPDTTNSKISLAATNAVLDSMVAPWISPTSAKQALDFAPTTDRVHKSGVRKQVFSESTLRMVWETNQIESNLDALIADSVHATELNAAVLRAVSQNTTSADERVELEVMARQFANELSNAVSIVSAGTVAFAGESGIVPITIKNELTIPVTLQIQALGVPSVRVVPAPIEMVTIQPGQRKSIEIPTTLRGSDTAYLNLQLLTIDSAEIGNPVRIQLTSSAYSKIAAFVVYGASALLLIMIVLNVIKRIRAGKSTGAENE